MPTASRARFTPPAGPRTRASPCPRDSTGTSGSGRCPGAPYAGEAGHTLPGYFVGDVNWAPHHYDIIQWTINPDPTAPIEVSYEAKGGKPDNAVIHYRYSNGVQVHSTSYPGEPVGDVGGACFVGTEGRIAVDRDNIVSYPATHPHGAAASRRQPGLSCRQPFGELPRMRPHPAADDLQSRDCGLYHERHSDRRHLPHPQARADVGPGQSRVRR